MNFANATFLWGLLALSIPIIVHLFNFRKAKLIQFSNVRFLDQVKKKSSTTRQLKHLLILFCRMAFLAFLVLAFAQPYIPGQEEGLKENTVILYVDNSGSMSNLTSENTAALNVAIAMAQDIIALYPQTTTFKLLDNNFAPYSTHYKSADKTLDLLSELSYSSVSRSGQEIMDKIASLTNSSQKNEIFILSDMQHSTFGQIKLIQDSLNQYYLVPLSIDQTHNVHVDTAYLHEPFILAHKDNILSAKIRNNGNNNIEDLIVKLQLNEKQAASLAIDIAPHSTKTIDFELSKNLPPHNQGKIEFQDFPVTFDNEFFLSFNLAPKIHITEIKEQQTPTYTQRVFEGNSLFEFNTYTTGNISYQSLENADLLIVSQLHEINHSLVSQISQRLDAGKSVLLIPHQNTGLGGLEEALNIHYLLQSEVSKIELAKPDVNHPFFEGIFESLDQNTRLPQASPVLQLQTYHQPLLQLKTGTPFLVQLTQLGKLYIYTAPMADTFTSFHKHAFFVPVMQRIAELSATGGNKLYYTSDNPTVQVSLDTLDPRALYKLRPMDIDHQELIPSQRTIQNQLVMDFPQYLLSPGNYALGTDTDEMGYIAFNPTPSESNLAIMEPEELEVRLSGLKHRTSFDQIESKNFSKILKEKYHSIELWKYALLLSLAFLIAESMLLRFL
ncbi:hypothetical protein BFP72_13685 [Reichenbachiella sp. 5M10]|uniref:BatA domain-containing protein n=1 Tax=Reichenbachiella sp. 5M10 TaxID=1889772 RepID=UPI000C15484A|nr:BatA domain-containing protein [Reichenbachiella sp. 5M10]PIB36371.1 hypothetical protein BFP72_13685 [Reichenbachiella sp. 5M10]